MTDMCTLANRQTAREPRITSKVRKAIHAIVWNGASRSEAARTAGLQEDSLYRAMRRPHVLSSLRQAFENRRTGEPFRAYARQVELAESANSEDVRLRANQWIAGCDGSAMSPPTAQTLPAD